MSDQAGASRAEAEAARWFETLRKTAVTTEALRDFHAWKREPVNAAAFGRVEAGWKAAGAVARHPDVQAEAAALLRRYPAKRRVDWRVLVAPVAVVGAAGLAWFAAGTFAPTYETGVGEQRVVALSDGSRVRLNTDSAVRVWYWGDTRRIYLRRGEAMFAVAHDPARPFLVEAGRAQVRALGTKFDVRREPDGVAVTLLEGRVRVASGTGAAKELAPNQRLRVTAAGVSAVQPVSAAQSLSWTTGRLVFQGVPLRDAVREANRYSRRKLELAVPEEIAGEQVSGTFEAGDVDAVVAALTHYYGLEATHAKTTIRLTPRSAQ